MASAFIIFKNSQRLALASISAQLADSLGFGCELSEWRFGDSVIPQIRVSTLPPIALQLDEDPDIVREEIRELLESYGSTQGEISLVEARQCDSIVEVVSCELTRTEQFHKGGIVSHTPNVDMDSPDVQLALRRVAAFLHGWTFDNINGRWI